MSRQSILFLTICILTLPWFCGCDFVYRFLQKEGAEEKELLGEVIPFEHNSRVEEVQTLLKFCGYNPGSTDGKFGVKTRVAIEAFQKDNGLKITRFVDKTTWAQLDVINQAGLMRDGEVNIHVLQVILKNAGFDSGSADGKLGPKTVQAIKAFQAAHGLTADGQIGQKTVKLLLKYINHP